MNLFICTDMEENLILRSILRNKDSEHFLTDFFVDMIESWLYFA